MRVTFSAVAGRAFALALALLGGILLLGGIRLISLGGSWWYAPAGAVLLTSSALLWFRNRWGAWLYGLLLIVTILWSLGEVGFDGWALLPRLGLLAAGGLWLLTPWAGAGLRGPGPLLSARARASILMSVAVVLVLLIGAATISLPGATSDAPAQPASAAAETNDWRHYGNDANGTRHSPLTQIQPANVRKLTLAWSMRTGYRVDPGVRYTFEATPLQIGRLLYLCTAGGVVHALDASNGRQAWQFAQSGSQPRKLGEACRGVAYAELAGTSGSCAQRIFWPSPDNRLWALDALTGEPCADFGSEGAVDLRDGLGDMPPHSYGVTSPPVVVHERVVIGSTVDDRTSVNAPSGVVRAFDAHSGKLLWAWDVGRPDQRGAPPPGETYTRSTPDVWAPMVADAQAGLIYLPTGTASVNFNGGQRRDFDEAYGTSIVALSADTGTVRWKFQITHHDIWDFDVASQPTLFDMPGPQGAQPALAIGTKSGGIFILDRLTGEPIVPVVEKPVASDSSVEANLSRTQPESALVVNPGPARLSEASMWGISPVDQLWCRIHFRDARYDGPYTPPGLDKPTLVYPGMFGGVNWGGLSLDPVRRVLIANPVAMPVVLRMARVGTSEAAELEETIGTGYAHSAYGFFSPLYIPCLQPPWGALFAIDLESRRILWQRRVGLAVDSGPRGIPVHLPLLMGTPQVGGTITTRSGLIFSAATLDRYLRAYDIASGRELWKTRLPAGGQATPMTYQLDGRQYLVLAVGGHKELGTKAGDYVMAWTLPERAGAN
jgi:quinoprotein glucose dehydrogenase